MHNIGILGSSSYALRSILPELRALNQEVGTITIGTRNPSRIDYLINENIHLVDNYDSLINDSRIDSIYIALPNAMHFDYAKKSLLSGKAVLVEKPLALSLDEALELIEIAEERALPVVEAFHFRFHSQLSELKKILDSGKIGEIRCYRTSFGVPPFQNRRNIRYQKTLGGGAGYDLAVYPLRLAPLLMGEQVAVRDSNIGFGPRLEVDLYGGGTVTQLNGNLFMQFAYGFENFYRCELEVWGSKGLIKMNRIFTAPPELSTTMHIMTDEGDFMEKLQPDNQYKKLVEYFFQCNKNSLTRSQEYSNISLQARLVDEFFHYRSVDFFKQ